MTICINDVMITDVFKLGVCNCELSIVFNKDHHYSSIEEIENILNKVGISIGNFYFKGVSMWKYFVWFNEVNPELSKLIQEDGETSCLCVIPENIRDTFHVSCW